MTPWRVLVTTAVWVVLSVSLWATDARPAVLVLGGIVAVIAAAAFVTVDLAEAVVAGQWTRRRQRPVSTRSSDPRVTALRHQIEGARWTGSSQLRGTLVELIDDRLLANRQIDRASDPAAAMDALTPTLRRLVDGSRRQFAGVDEMRRILHDIESL